MLYEEKKKGFLSISCPYNFPPAGHVSALNSPLPDGLCNCTPLLSDGVRGVTVTKTGSGAIVVSAKSERKRGISAQNTNQLAGNRTFISPLTLISLQGKCPRSHLTALPSLPWCFPNCALCLRAAAAMLMISWPAAANSSELTAAAPGYRDRRGNMGSVLS